jgi:cytochrome c553
MQTKPLGLIRLLVCLGVPLVFGRPSAADQRSGEQIYQKRCASCHGKSGEGTEENYPRPLTGKRTVDQLAKLIARTMPKDAPQKCTAEDARLVAAYIHLAFYASRAQERNQTPRVELSRLTVRQFRQSVADLIGSFRSVGLSDGQRGLKGEYFKSRRFRSGERVFERVDPVVQFDFGLGGPEPAKFNEDVFSIRWEGSVVPPETGEYEFIIRTEHAGRLWVNHTKQPLIDAWVKSGNDAEYKASITLLAGRAYPLRLEFAKGKQGVPDKKKDEKPPPAKSSIALAWKPPHGTVETIPQRSLAPHTSPVVYVATTAFPADDRSVGYERGTAVSKAWDQATTDAAIDAAGYVVGSLRELAGIQNEAQDRRRVREFCLRFAERAFRRPLSDEQKRLYVDRQLEAGPDLETSVKRVVLLVLKSPRFLYPDLDDQADSYDAASRIALALWDSLPDQELLNAASKGQLVTRDQVARQAERMMGDLRTKAKMRDLLFQWLKLDPAPDVSKDPRRFSGFDASVLSDLRTSLQLFLQDVLWSEASDFRQLLLADYVYLNGRLAGFYGVKLPANTPFQKVALNPSERAGVLTHPYLMATFAYTAESSPIHRGVLLARNVLGAALPPPPDAFTPLAANLHPKLTTRERVTLQTNPQACVTCHGVINPLGFALEHFDAVGRYREQESGRPIDATGFYKARSGEEVRFSGATELATFLANSQEVQNAFIERLFHNLVKQPVAAYGPEKLSQLRASFAQNHYNVRRLVTDIVAESALMRQSEKRVQVRRPAELTPVWRQTLAGLPRS